MNAIPKSGDSGLFAVVVEGNLVVECEVVAPPSMAGRTIHVYFKPEHIPGLIGDARWAGISYRQTSEVGRVDDR